MRENLQLKERELGAPVGKLANETPTDRRLMACRMHELNQPVDIS
jgi:hypothetical protein